MCETCTNNADIIDELKAEIIYGDNSSRLYELLIELTEKTADLHMQLVKDSEDETSRIQIKGRLLVYKTLIRILDQRITETKNTENEKMKREFFTARQFRIAAEAVLQKDTFEKIKQLSFMKYSDLKKMKPDLKSNKLE